MNNEDKKSVWYRFEYIDQFGNSTKLNKIQDTDIIDNDVITELGNMVENLRDFLYSCGFHPNSVDNYINTDGLANND